jgi:hypothetical protein
LKLLSLELESFKRGLKNSLALVEILRILKNYITPKVYKNSKQSNIKEKA